MKTIREVLKKIPGVLKTIPGTIPGTIRGAFKRYPVVTAAAAVAVVLVVGFRVYHGIVRSPAHAPQPAISKAVPAAPSPAKSAAPEAARVPSAAPPAPQVPTGTLPPGPLRRAAVGPLKRDVFIPLVSSGSGGPLPPVPSLGLGGLPLPAGGLSAGDLRLVGIIGNTGAVAIVVDARGSYVVEAGDEIGPDVLVERIDARRGVVAVRRAGVREELRMPPLQRGGAGQ